MNIDALLICADHALRTLSGSTTARRARPLAAADTAPTALSPEETRLSGALMRVNHVGEICAQALYEAQALNAQHPHLRAELHQAAEDEQDHLAWTADRLRELGARPSLLNPLWYAGAFAMGTLAARAGDQWSLGFVAETERQVEQHLAEHLSRLPQADHSSRAIVDQMKLDEARHAEMAETGGAHPLPAPVRWLMKGAAGVMTRTAHHL